MILLQQLGQSHAAIEKLLRRGIQIGAELRKGFHLAILGQFQLNRARNFFHSLDLGRRSNAGNRQANVNGRADTTVEQIGFQEDLTIGNGNYVGRNIGGDVVGLGLDDWQRRQGTKTVVFVHLGGAFQ